MEESLHTVRKERQEPDMDVLGGKVFWKEKKPSSLKISGKLK